MSKLSVVIPSRNSPFAQKTVDDIFAKATGDIEVIIVLDGYWPDPPLNAHKDLVIIHRGSPHGMRAGINTGAQIAKGDYIMKCDDHCMFGEGFDEILKADCEDNWIVIPSKYSLDAEKWERTRGPVDYWYLTYPYNVDEMWGTGFHGKKWKGEHGFTGGFWHRENERRHILIDDIITFQGSCWFMPKELFLKIDCLDQKNYNHHQEAQELGFKIWLSGGRNVVNKKTWYAHLHKGKTYGRGFFISKREMVKSEKFSTDFWMNNRWSKQTKKLKWLIEKDCWWPLGGWPEDWDDPEYAEKWIHIVDVKLREAKNNG